MVHELVQKFSLTRDFIPRRDYRDIGSILRTKVWGTQYALGLCRDLTVPFPAPRPSFRSRSARSSPAMSGRC